MIKRLISISLRSLFATIAAGKGGGRRGIRSVKLVGIFALFGLLGLVFAGIFTAMAITMAWILFPLGLEEVYFGIFASISFAVIFCLSIFEIKSEMFECKDNELLLSMPIKPSAIVVSRAFAVLILNLVESILFMLPSVIVYACCGGSLGGIVGGILAVLLIPLLASALASGFGYLFAIIAKKLKKKSLLTSFFAVVLLIAFYSVYFGLLDFEGNPNDELAALGQNSFMKVVGLCVILHPIATPLFAVVSVGAAALAYFIIARGFASIVTAAPSAKRTEYKGERSVARAPLAAFVMKELNRYKSSSSYILNSSMGMIFLLLLGGASVIYRSELKLIAAAFMPFGNIIPLALTVCGIFCAGMNMISAASLSLEGDSFWIVKSMPIGGKTVLIAKALAHIIITTPLTAIYSAVLIVVSGADFPSALMSVVILLSSNVLFALLGINLNVAFPKLKFANIAQVVKQSASVGLSMLAATVWTMGIVAGGICLTVVASPTITLLAILGLTLAVCALLAALLLGPCVRRCEKLG